jgi:tripartite-type tricarboxylate transporter receptor subunit TctC
MQATGGASSSWGSASKQRKWLREEPFSVGVADLVAGTTLQACSLPIACRGAAPAAVDVLAGHFPLAVLDVPASLLVIRDGKLKALGASAS